MVSDMKRKYSILVPTRDRLGDIEIFLESLTKTGFKKDPAVEIIIVNNGRESKKLRALCKKHGAIYVREPRKGKSVALNTGLKRAKGEFIVCTDDDVIITDPAWLKKLNSRAKGKIAYVSGNVIAYKKHTQAQKSWEKKGGLSKGKKAKYFSREYLSQFRFKPWPITKICAGANCIIKRKALLEAGGFSEFFGPGAPIGHGESLIIGYELMRLGYELYYEPKSFVLHNHPEAKGDIQKKLFLYATGDTALHLHIFFKYGDLRSLWWAFVGHPIYVTKNMIKYFFGQYVLSPKYTLFTIAGSVLGPYKYLYKRLRRG